MKKSCLKGILLSLIFVIGGCIMTFTANADVVSKGYWPESGGEWYLVDGIEGGEVKFNTDTGELCGNDEAITIAVIPETILGVEVATISHLSNCGDLTILEIPDTVTSIINAAFTKNTSLKEIVIPESVTYLSANCFNGCTSLETVQLSSNILVIEEGLFTSCSNLEEIVIPEGVETISNFVFFECTSLKTAYIPSTVQEMGGGVFYGCENLSDIYYAGTEEEWNEIYLWDLGMPDSTIIHYLGGPTTQYREETEFTLGVDSNYFTHSARYENSGFYGATSYYLTDSDRVKLFAEATSTGDYASLTDSMYSDWIGSCYGIANVMGAVYNNDLSISDISSSTGSSFYNLTSPAQDNILMSSINYYQLQQYISDTELSYMFSTGIYFLNFYLDLNTVAESATFFQTAMKYLDQGQCLVMSMYAESHAILIVDYEYDSENNNYIFTLFNENTVSSPGDYGEFYYWTVSENLEKFSVSDNCPYDIDSTDKYGIGLTLPGSRAAGTVGDYVTFVLDTKGNYVINMGNGQCIYCENQSLDISGTIHGGSSIVFDSEDESSSKYIIEMDLTEEFEIIEIEGDIDIAIYSNDAYVSIAGSNIDSASIVLGEELIVEGDDYEFESFITTSELNEDGTPKVISISGMAETDVEVEVLSEEIKVDSEGTIENFITTTYNEGQIVEEEIIEGYSASNNNLSYVIIGILILGAIGGVIFFKRKK